MCEIRQGLRAARFALVCVFMVSSARARADDAIAPTPLADPGFRLLAAQPDGTQLAMDALEESHADKVAILDWLRAHAKPEKDLGIECRLLAALARGMHAHAEEIEKADDLVLRSEPDRVEGWIHRAAQNADREGAQSAAWAAEAYAQGLRRVDFSWPGWHDVLHFGKERDWVRLAVDAGQIEGWIRALATALRDTPQNMARLDAATFVLRVMREQAVRAKPALIEPLLAAIEESQPQMVLGDVTGVIEVMRGFESAGRLDAARRLARWLVEAKVAAEVTGDENETAAAFSERWSNEHPEPARPAEKDSLSAAKHQLAQRAHVADAAQAAALRGGCRTLINTWEDTMPRYQAATTARQILALAMDGDERPFAVHLLELAAAQPRNESLICHALLATALADQLKAEHLALASALGVQARGRIAQRLHAFALADHLPLAALAAWVEGGALAAVHGSEGRPMERAIFESLLLSMDGLQRADAKEALARVLAAVRATPPRAIDVEHWQRLSVLTLRAGDEGAARDLAKSWLGALAFGPVEREHLFHIANAAVLGGVERGRAFARAALEIWKRQYESVRASDWPLPGVTSRVAQALIETDDVDGFREFVTSLQPAAAAVRGSYTGRMVDELAALRDLLDGKGRLCPAVDVWMRTGSGAERAATVQWQFVLPELGSSTSRPITITTGDRDSRRAFDEFTDARWWHAGAVVPALAHLSGRYDLMLYTGTTRSMRVLATIRGASSAGECAAANAPASGCVRAGLRSQLGDVSWSGQPRYYSTMPAVFTTGDEPAASERDTHARAPVVRRPQLASWTEQDEERWGALIADPVPLDGSAEYLLTRWPQSAGAQKDLAVRMIMLDEKQRPLGPVPLVSTAPQGFASVSPLQTPPAGTHRALTQRFRPGDWQGDGDLVEPLVGGGRAGSAAPRFAAFVTREKAAAPQPLLQLRPFSGGDGTGVPDDSFSSTTPPMPELNDEHMGDLGFYVHSWHVTFASDRAILTGKGILRGFDPTHVPWRQLVATESPLIEGNEWPMCFTAARALIVEPPWNHMRDLGVRFLPFDAGGKSYPACERKTLPLPTYNNGELSAHLDGAVLLVSSEHGDKPEPVCSWMEPDGHMHVLPLPRPPIRGNPGLEVAWWGPGGTKFTLHEDGLLFHIEHINGLRLLGVEEGDPDKIPEGCTPGKRKRKRTWVLERPDVLAELDKKTSATLRRYHLRTPCEGKPMSFDREGYVILFALGTHEILRVNPPPRE